MGVEIYGNRINSTMGGNFFDHRGGKAVVYNNLVVGLSTTGEAWWIRDVEECIDSANAVTVAEDGTPQRVNSAYYWNNRFGQTGWRAIKSTEGTDVDGSIAPDQNWWRHVESGFDGSSGMGAGPLAGMPASAASTGVGYWATDQNCTAVDESLIGSTHTANIDGTFYRWDGSTWVAWFTPYTYPHPFTV
jgi:hypothetical protein